MRSFLQKKAGATYFSNSPITASIRKHNMEFIFSLSGGWHAVVSFTPTPDGVVMLAGLGSMSDTLDRVIPTLRLKPGEHTKFIDIIGGKSEYQFMNVNFSGKGDGAGIGKMIKMEPRPHMQLLGDPDIHEEAEKLYRLMLDIYNDLRKSPYPFLKSLTDHFYD